MHEIIDPTVKAMREMGRPFTGVLFAGLMMTKTGPEADRIQRALRRSGNRSDVAAPEIRFAVVALCREQRHAGWRHDSNGARARRLCVIMAAEGYPGTYKKGTVIRGLEKAAAMPMPSCFMPEPRVTLRARSSPMGGRVLCVTAMGGDDCRGANACLSGGR